MCNQAASLSSCLTKVQDSMVRQLKSLRVNIGQVFKLDRKVVVKPQTSPKSRPRVSRSINDNYCVLNVAGVKNSVHVSGKKQDLNPSSVANKSETVFLHVNSFAANVHSVTGLRQKKGVNPNLFIFFLLLKYI